MLFLRFLLPSLLALSLLCPLVFLESFSSGIDLNLQNEPITLQVGQATLKNPRDITEEREATQTGVRLILEAMRANQNLLKISREELLKALPYFEQARKLFSNATTELNVLLLNSLVAGNAEHVDLIRKFDAVAEKFKDNEYGSALVNYYEGYMYELLLQNVNQARVYWAKARASPYYELHENFWDDAATPPRYPRYWTMKPSSYRRFLLPLLVYLYFRDQYEGILTAGDIPEFPSDENRFQENKEKGIEVNWGFDILMGRQNIKEASEFLKKYEFVFLRHFYSMEEVNLLTEFYQGNVLNDTWKDSYDPYLMRTNVYNDRLGFFLNKRKEIIANQLTEPRKMKMAYSFLCHYEDFGGRESSYNGRPNLRAHTDRKDNELTFSITLGNSPLWPLFVHKNPVPNPGSLWREVPPISETIEIPVRTGDALIFFGRKHTHWRNPMPVDVSRYSSILHHFVDWEFDFIHYKTYGENGNY